MRIGTLAKLTGLTASRIRFYEKAGLIGSASRQANGYREFPPDAVWILEIIDSAQRAGFSLEQIQQLLPAREDGRWDHAALLGVLRAQVEAIRQQQVQLERSRQGLESAIASLAQRPAKIACQDNRQRVLDVLHQAGLLATQPGRIPRF